MSPTAKILGTDVSKFSVFTEIKLFSKFKPHSEIGPNSIFKPKKGKMASTLLITVSSSKVTST